jgi:hypothetical protein
MNWSGIEQRTPRRQAGDYPPEPLHEFNNSNLYLCVLTKEGVKTVSATTHRKKKNTRLDIWRTNVRYSVPNKIHRFCSMTRWIKLSFKRNRPQCTSFQRSDSSENCVLLDYYAASCGNFLTTFRANLSVPSSRIKNPKLKPDILVRGLNREQCGRW